MRQLTAGSNPREMRHISAIEPYACTAIELHACTAIARYACTAVEPYACTYMHRPMYLNVEVGMAWLDWSVM